MHPEEEVGLSSALAGTWKSWTARTETGLRSHSLDEASSHCHRLPAYPPHLWTASLPLDPPLCCKQLSSRLGLAAEETVVQARWCGSAGKRSRSPWHASAAPRGSFALQEEWEY